MGIWLDDAILLDPEAAAPRPGGLLVDGERILECLEPGAPGPAGFDRISLNGRHLAPGFVDLHYHGRLALNDAGSIAASLSASSASLAGSGTTAFLATTVAAPSTALTQRVTQIAAALAGSRWPGARPIGVHLEGPWINPAAAGAQPAGGIRDFRRAELTDLLAAAGGALRMVTLAPEIPGNRQLQAELLRRDITVALGHSHASAGQAREAVERGATHVTHLFNAMGALHHREPGLAGAALADDRLTCDLICDGVHVDPAMVAVASRAKRDRLALISDRIEMTHRMTRASNADDAPSHDARVEPASMGGQALFDDGTAWRLADGRLAGSRLRLDDAVANLRAFAGVTLLEAVTAATLTPARAIGVERDHGTLRAGARADLVVLDAEGRLVETWVSGRPVASARE